VLGLLILAVAAGVLWAFTAPVVTQTVTEEISGFALDQTREFFGSVVVFAFISVGLGLIIGAAVWFGMPRNRGLGGLAYAVVASLAVAAIAMDVGQRVATMRFGSPDLNTPGEYKTISGAWLDGASLWGISAPWLALTIAPGLATLFYFFMVGASSSPDLGRGDLPVPAPAPVYVPPQNLAPGELAAQWDAGQWDAGQGAAAPAAPESPAGQAPPTQPRPE